MTVYDSSVLIEYLDGDSTAVEYVKRHADERAVAPPLVAFEVYQGEVFKSCPADFDALDSALEWVVFLDETLDLARAAAELQNELHRQGQALSPRDAYIAGTATALDESLVVADADFDVEGLTELLDVEFLA
ncbi:PIN domain-containing protein [Haloarcula nitratireducens]|uniref:Ribonuclease VapC n=1 Tax=Haloarcula nitratireducens TaxID=2487749 RepID=A0AAW4PFG3_9EURY|nr:PIN domain-containing protein [Halomicroarcula nitratireducens]MBX0296715.1 PIN domain-containing protein [Halomicroarcula nitratireducens]